MAPKRLTGLAAVCASKVAAGTMDSRKGRARTVPAPRSRVRRDRCFLLMNAAILFPSNEALAARPCLFQMPAHFSIREARHLPCLPKMPEQSIAARGMARNALLRHLLLFFRRLPCDSFLSVGESLLASARRRVQCRGLALHSHLELRAADDAEHQFGETIVLVLRLLHD